MMYIFGYGSLISVAGINGRGMARIYQDEDLKEAILHGYRREWNVVWDNMKFLGIVPDLNHTVNGVLIPISPDDLTLFKKSEGIGEEFNPPMYDLVDVTDHFFGVGIPSQNQVFTCVTKHPRTNGVVMPYYFDILDQGFQTRGEKFTERFLKTTFPKDILDPICYKENDEKYIPRKSCKCCSVDCQKSNLTNNFTLGKEIKCETWKPIIGCEIMFREPNESTCRKCKINKLHLRKIKHNREEKI